MGSQNSTPLQRSQSVATQQKIPRAQEIVQEILAEADTPIDKSSPDKLRDQLSSTGIFLAKKTKKFWVNKKLNCNCFMLYARALVIMGGEDLLYWKWGTVQESSETSIEVAEQRRVCWVDVSGKLDIKMLTPGVMYGVSFHVKLKNSVQYGWDGAPAYVTLEFRGVKYQEQTMDLSVMLKETWMEIPVAQFIAPAHGEGGEMKFSLWEHGDYWKRGLIVKGASIKPL